MDKAKSTKEKRKKKKLRNREARTNLEPIRIDLEFT